MKNDCHFLQTKAWGTFQEALGRQVLTGAGDDWHWQAIVERGRLGTRLYCPYGPTATSEKALDHALQTLKAAGREYGAIFVRVEPVAPVSSTWLEQGTVPAPRDIQPEHTWQVGLNSTEEELVAAMRATNRNLHRTAAKKGILFRNSSDPKDIRFLLDFVHEVARRTGIRPHSDTYFRKQAGTLLPLKAAQLFFAELDGVPIAAALVYDSATTRYYAHAGGSYEQRKLHAGTPLVSHMMLDAKQSGLTTFDFYGVAPPGQPNHAWSGFTDFKKSFGGYQHDYNGTWDIPLKPVQYRLYRNALLIARKVSRK